MKVDWIWIMILECSSWPLSPSHLLISFCTVFSQMNTTALDWSQLSKKECLKYGGQLVGSSCKFVPDLALMSFILFFGTYSMTVSLKKFKFSRYFPTKVWLGMKKCVWERAWERTWWNCHCYMSCWMSPKHSCLKVLSQICCSKKPKKSQPSFHFQKTALSGQ